MRKPAESVGDLLAEASELSDDLAEAVALRDEWEARALVAEHEMARLRKERDAAVAERWTALELARELRAEVERLRAERSDPMRCPVRTDHPTRPGAITACCVRAVDHDEPHAFAEVYEATLAECLALLERHGAAWCDAMTTADQSLLEKLRDALGQQKGVPE